jgi:peptide/nickel transport system ATP-binding protein
MRAWSILLANTNMYLDITDLHVTFNRAGRSPLPAVVGVSLRVNQGKLVALVGESGSGKSSLARAAVGLIRPASGNVLFNGVAVRQIGPRARAASEIGLQMVFQNPSESLNPRRRVGAQLADGLAVSGTKRNLRRLAVMNLLAQVGLGKEAVSRYPHQLSGGQRQRIAIARALAVGPSIVVLDEPFASLDASAQAQLANLLRTLVDEAGVGMLLISHDLAIVRHIADEVAVMYLGTIVETGAKSRMWDSPLHPYTEALINSIPVPDGAGSLPVATPGEIGDPAKPPSGCRFHPRCLYAFDKCSQQTPPLIEVARGRKVACWLRYDTNTSAPTRGGAYLDRSDEPITTSDHIVRAGEASRHGTTPLSALGRHHDQVVGA